MLEDILPLLVTDRLTLLSLTRESRRRALLTMEKEEDMLSWDADFPLARLRCSLLYQPSSSTDEVRLPYVWQVRLLGCDGPLSGRVPCHELWRESLHGGVDDVHARLLRDLRPLFVPSEGEWALLSPYDLLQWMRERLDGDMPSLDFFFSRAITPLRPLLLRMQEAQCEYWRWSYRRGARRLGLLLPPAE